MLTTEATRLVLKSARGLIKLSRRIDTIWAEKEAVESPLVLPVPKVGLAPTQPKMRRALRHLLEQTRDESPDPLGADRVRIENAVEDQPDNTVLFQFMQKYLPEQALGGVLDLDGDFLKELKALYPDWASDPDLIISSFYIGSGRDERNKSYTWRLGMTVVDSLVDFGADNTALFVRDPGLQSVAAGILKRFGNADIQTSDSTGTLFKTVLGATLNGVLGSNIELDIDNPWLGALFDALFEARATMPEGEQDDFVIGLLQGKGYPVLVSSVLTKAVGALDDAEFVSLKRVTVDFLTNVANVVKEQPTFENFFQQHWGDLLRAGLSSLEIHGPALLEGSSPLLRDVLLNVAKNLAGSSDSKFLSTEVLIAIVDTTVSVVATHPDEVDRLTGETWLGVLVNSVSATISDDGIRAVATKQGIESLVKETLGVFAMRPDLVLNHPGLARDLLKGVLTSLSRVDTLSAESLASAAMGSALIVAGDHPEILKFKYADQVASLAGKVGVLVKDRQLTRAQAVEILKGVIKSLAENPSFFLEADQELVGLLLDAVMKAARASGGLLSGAILVKTIVEVIRALAATGKEAIRRHPLVEELVSHLEELLMAALERAEEELGKLIGLGSLPSIIGRLVRAWSRGEIEIDPGTDNFRRLFVELVEPTASN